MNSPIENILVLNRLLGDAESELVTVLTDLAAANERIAALEAEAAAASAVMCEQQQLLAAHQHASVLAYEANQVLAAEVFRLRAQVMGETPVLAPPAGCWRN